MNLYDGVTVLSLRADGQTADQYDTVQKSLQCLHEIRVEDVELVTLHNLGRRIVGASEADKIAVSGLG